MNAVAPDMLSRLILKWDRFTLGNGLRVVVHTDRRAPLATVDVTYLVGAKDEESGQNGIAHLFEHLMFTGTKALPGPFMARLAALGALITNAETSNDVTHYWNVVPSGMVEFMLYAEADRMGTLDRSLTQSALDQQRSIVLQEKRERAPFMGAMTQLRELIFPIDHPYRRGVIGQDVDIENTTLSDARIWYQRYYSPSNAVLTICGDVDLETVKPMVERYFASIPPGPPLKRDLTWMPAISTQRRVRLEDTDAKATKLTFKWILPGTAHPDVDLLELFLASLGSDNPGMLKDQFVTRDGLAKHVACAMDRSNTLCSQASIDVILETSFSEAVEAGVCAFVRRKLEQPLDDALLERIKIDRLHKWASDLERLEARARMLSFGESRFGNPDNHVLICQKMMRADSAAILSAARRWLSCDPAVLEIVPFIANASPGETATASTVPEIVQAPAIFIARHRPLYPKVEHAVLSNGLKVVTATDFKCDSTAIRVASNIGYADETPTKRGLLAMTEALWLKGAGGRDHDALVEALSSHSIMSPFGVSATSSSMDYIFPTEATNTALDLLADIVSTPRFPKADLESYREATLKTLRRARTLPAEAWQIQMEQLFGRGHPITWSRGGTEASVATFGVDDVRTCHRAIWNPSKTTILCAGSLSLEHLVAFLETRADVWPNDRTDGIKPGAVPSPRPSTNSLAFSNDPGSAVCSVKAARLLPGHTNAPLAALAVSHALGGTVNSRLMHRLREERGWAYGCDSGVTTLNRMDVAPVLALQTSVSMQHAAATVADIMDVMAAMAGHEPITALERGAFVARSEHQFHQTPRKPQMIVASLARQVSTGRPLGGWEAEREALANLTLESIRSAAESMLSSASFSWTMTGDAAVIEQQFAASGPRAIDLARWDVNMDGA